MIAYNRAMFDQMGVPSPRPGWTWDDFQRAARATTSPGADKMRWLGFRDGFGSDPMLLLALAGPLVDYRVAPPVPLLDAPLAARAAAWYAGLRRGGFIATPDGQRAGRRSAVPTQAAMWIELVDAVALPELALRRTGLAPFPAGPDAGATNPIEIENAFAISAGTNDPDAAWALVSFLLDYRADGGPAGLPAQPRLAPGAQAPDRDAGAALDYALNHAQRAAPLRREEYFARAALLEAVSRLAMGAEDAEQVMQEAQAAARMPAGR